MECRGTPRSSGSGRSSSGSRPGRYTTAQDLADEHGVTERTIRRDIEALQEAGFPLYDERADGRKIWRLVEGYKQQLDADLHARRAGGALLQPEPACRSWAARPSPRTSRSAFAKIREALPAAACRTWRASRTCSPRRPDPWKDYSKKQDVIAALIDAILHQRQARIAYFSFNSRRTKVLRSTPTGSSTTTAGSTSTRGPTSTTRCARSRWSASRRSRCWSEAFEVPADFNASEYARGAFGIITAASRQTVEIWCSPRRWPATSASASGTRARSSETEPDGSVRLLRMSVAPGFELKSWIKGFLPHVQRDEPGVAARRDRARARGGEEGLPAWAARMGRRHEAAMSQLEDASPTRSRAATT